MRPERIFSIVTVIAALVHGGRTVLAAQLDGTTGLVDIELDFSADS